jgi:hypothetical protein
MISRVITSYLYLDPKWTDALRAVGFLGIYIAVHVRKALLTYLYMLVYK